MNAGTCSSRRSFLRESAAAGVGLASSVAWNLVSGCSDAGPARAETVEAIGRIKDAEIRAGVEAAVFKNLVPAATERSYPGHFTISADGVAFGGNTTWPGLDSWQMTGAYLLLGRTRLVLDYFEFVRASQRKDGNIPFAVFVGETRPDNGCLRGLKHPDDVFTYKPPKREGLPASSQTAHSWIGLFTHWQLKANPLSSLAPICYVLTAAEIFDATGSLPWLQERLTSIEAAAKFLVGRKSPNGLIAGSGFYIECPPRFGWDGVTQCYAIRAFRDLARLFHAVGDKTKHADWSAQADRLAESFVAAFWRQDHFAEYIHAERGLVDSHGLSDVNWAAVALGVAAGEKLERLWPRLMNEPGFWHGGMPTLCVTKPFSYEKWELNEPVPFEFNPLNDVAAMGRVWHLEATACKRMRATDRLVESVRKVCRAGKADGHWRERYHPLPDGTVKPAGAQKYCEYAAILTRVVLGNREIFCS